MRSTEHNYILALERWKKKERLYFDVLVFASQQYVLKGNYSDLSFQRLLSTAEKIAIAAAHLHLNFYSSYLTRIQLNESAQFAKKAAEVNKTSGDADKKRH